MKYPIAPLGMLMITLAAATMPGHSQQQNAFADMLSGSKAPLTMRMKDLGDGWRQFRVQDKAVSQVSDLVAAAIAPQGIDMPTQDYYTRGETVAIGPETYLIAYQTKHEPIDPQVFANMFSHGMNNDRPEPRFLTPDTELVLALLNQRTMGNVLDIKPVRAADMLAKEAKRKEEWAKRRSAEVRQQSYNNLQTLAAEMLSYARYRNDNTLPVIGANVSDLQQYLHVHAGVWQQPQTREPYRTNPLISSHKLGHITQPEEMILFYENTPDSDGNRYVAFLDGHVSLVSAADWPLVKRVSRLPQPSNENLTMPATPESK